MDVHVLDVACLSSCELRNLNVDDFEGKESCENGVWLVLFERRIWCDSEALKKLIIRLYGLGRGGGGGG